MYYLLDADLKLYMLLWETSYRYVPDILVLNFIRNMLAKMAKYALSLHSYGRTSILSGIEVLACSLYQFLPFKMVVVLEKRGI